MALGTSFTQITKSGLSSTSAYDTGHINSSGIITATKFVGTLEGNVTSDDWTNTATGISTTINVGIGTTNATSKLTVDGNISAAQGHYTDHIYIADKIVHTGDTNTAIRFPANDTFSIETAGTPRLKLTSGGV